MMSFIYLFIYLFICSRDDWIAFKGLIKCSLALYEYYQKTPLSEQKQPAEFTQGADKTR